MTSICLKGMVEGFIALFFTVFGLMAFSVLQSTTPFCETSTR